MSEKLRKISAAVCAVTVTMSCMSPLGAAAAETLTFETSQTEVFAASDQVEISAVNFPDETFRTYVLNNLDTNKDGFLTQAEMNAVQAIELMGTYDKSIELYSLTGIEYFPNLETLNCSYGKLSSLDLSSNPNLTSLTCTGNQISYLNVSKNYVLKTLNCSENQLTSLDVSSNSNLQTLSCSSNKITSLSLTNNTLLKSLDCGINSLTSLDVSRNTALTKLECYSNQITALNLSANTALTTLSCSSNKLTTLDVSKNTMLTNLGCKSNQLTSLNIGNNPKLATLDCSVNQLTTLDTSSNTSLGNLQCKSNKLESLNLSKNTQLYNLECSANQLTVLDVSANTGLLELYCINNHLTCLDVSKNTSLSILNCTKNTYSIGRVGSSYALSQLPGGFDPSRASDWTGAEYDGNGNLTNFTANTVTYNYELGNGKKTLFTLELIRDSEAPSKPVFTVTPGENSASLSWNSVTGATKYRVFYRVTGTESWSSADTTATSYTVTGLTGGTKYDFLVRATDGTLWSEYTDSDIKTATPTKSAADAPDLPKLTIMSGTQSVTIKWSAVTGAASYRIYYRQIGTTAWSKQDTTDTRYVLSGLAGGMKYEIVVLAYNGSAWSEYTDSDITIAIPNVTKAMTKPTFSVTAGTNSATVSWSAVSGATSYRVYYRLNGTTKWSFKDATATSCTISGLTGGKTYDFVVCQTDGTDWSVYADRDILTATPTAAVTPAPAKPTFTVTAGTNSATLSWNAVSGATSYTVFYRINGTSTWSKQDTTGTSYTLTGLTGGKKYDFLVRASNGSQMSEYTDSDIKTATPTAAVPAKPTFTVTAGTNSATLSWNAVTGATSYTVFYRINGTSTWSKQDTTSTSYTLTGLTGGKKYDFLVRASNGSQMSEFTDSDIKTATPAAAVPAKPTFTVTAGTNSATLSWNAVSGATNYEIRYRLNGTTSWTTKQTTGTSYTITGLTGGKKYDFLVRASNGSQMSEYTDSDIKTATPTAAAPAKPTFTVTAGTNSATLSWNAVSGATSYSVFYRLNGTTAWSKQDTTSTSYTLTGLTGGKKYDFLVRASNGSQMSEFTDSDIKTATPTAAAPAKPTFTVTAGTNSATLSWNAVSGATSYTVFYRINGTTTWSKQETTGTSYTLTGLTGGKKYDFLVRASNGSQMSEFTDSDIKTATPTAAAPAKPTFTVTAGTNSATLSWNAVTGATSYSIFYRINGTTTWSKQDTTGTSYTITGLTGGKKYDFLVRASNGSQMSEFTDSDIKTATPTEAVKPAPAKPTFTVTAGTNSVSISWNAVSGATNYEIRYRLNGTTSWTTKQTTGTSYTVTGLTGGKKYDFLVLASDGSQWSEYTDSDIKTATPAAAVITPPALPAFTATPGVNSMSLKWNAVSGAKSYRVYYRLNGAKKWTARNTTGTAVTISGLRGGRKYDFLVLAYNGKFSSFTSANIKIATPTLAVPALPSLTVTPGVNSMSLKWNAVSGARSYRVYYRLNGAKKWSVRNTTGTAVTISGLIADRKYDFLVLAYNGTFSKFTNSDIKIAAPKAANKPVIYSAVAGTNSVVLRWNAVSGAQTYRVYYRVSGTSKWSYKNTTKNAMNLTGLTGGKTYEFVVRSYNGSTWTTFTSADIVKAAVKS